MIEYTIEDLEDLKSDADQRSSLSGKAAFPGETRSLDHNVSIYLYCRDLCASFLDSFDQVEAMLADQASHSRKVPADEAWESAPGETPQVFVSPNLYAINRDGGNGLQIHFARLATQWEIMGLSRGMAQMWRK